MTRRRFAALRIARAFGAVPVVLLLSACAPQSPPDPRPEVERIIRELDAQWSKTAEANDLEGTISFYADDAYLLPPNAPIATGKAAIRASWASLLTPDLKTSWSVTKVDVARSGELAYLLGVYEVKARSPQDSRVVDRGKLLEVWKKQAGGQWKAVADIYNSDMPAAPAPETKTPKK